jgi:hypothetical protein
MRYEYECQLCKLIDDSRVEGCRFVVDQSIKDDALKKCGEHCIVPEYTGSNHAHTWAHDLQGIGNVKRIITGGSGFILKGSGFYSNDYKKKD